MKKNYFIFSVIAFALTLCLTYAISTPKLSVDENYSEQPKLAPETLSSARAANHKVYRETNNASIIAPEKPASIRDISHDVILKTTEAGDLVVDAEVKDLFEFYLSAIGEEPLEQTLYRIQHELEEQLNPPALDQAKSLLKRYVDYKIELVTLESEGGLRTNDNQSELDKIKLQKSQRSSLRSQYFDQSEYEPFFQQEEIYDNYMLEHLIISQDSNLTEAEQNQQLTTLERSLPQALQGTRRRVSLHSDLYESAIELRKTGATEEDIYQLRANTLGTEAATAMAELDQNRTQWLQRLDDFASDRKRIENSGLSKEDQSLAINRLVDSRFSGTEKIRVKAINQLL